MASSATFYKRPASSSDAADYFLDKALSYQKWKQKQKIDDRDSEEEGLSSQRGPGPRRGGKRGHSQGGQGRCSGPRGKARRYEVQG